MTSSKAIGLWPVQGLDRSALHNNAPANSDIPRVYAGNAATLHGYIVGGAILDAATANPAPDAPGHGLKGHDHSGGIHGQPLRRTIAAFDVGNGHEGEPSTDVDGNEDDVTLTFTTTATASSSDTDAFSTAPLMAWVPHCDPGELGAYTKTGVVVMGYASTTTNIQGGDTITIKVRNVTTGSEVDVLSTAPNAVGLFRCASTGTSDLLQMKPGALNVIRVVSAKFQASGTAATRTFAGHCSTVEIGVWLS